MRRTLHLFAGEARSTRAKKSVLVKTTQAISHARRQFKWQSALQIFFEYTREMKHSEDEPIIEMPLINTTITAALRRTPFPIAAVVVLVEVVDCWWLLVAAGGC